MPIITISRGSYHHGKAVAEKLAARLGYTCLSRDRIVEHLEQFHLPEIKMVRSIGDAFTVLDRFPHGKNRYKMVVRSAILQHFLAGNVVYHGLAGHHFVKDISHVLKVRIIADTEKRVSDEMAREHIPREKARHILKEDDEERRKWAKLLYGIDVMSPEAYNLIIRIGHISEDDAVQIICDTVKLEAFQETAASKAALADSAMEALVAVKLFDFPNADVAADDGRVLITLKAPEDQQQVIHDRIHHMLADIAGISELGIRFEDYF